MQKATGEHVRGPASVAEAIEQRQRAVATHESIKLTARRSFNKHVLSEIGGVAGLFSFDNERFPEPVLVSVTAGLGNKLQLAAELGLHSELGGDLVNHCVNDLATQGATPLFFQNYFAAGELDPQLTARIVGSMAEACKANGCALVGGETIELQDMHRGKAYDAAGFMVGVVSKPKLLDAEAIAEDDVLLALPSNGLHCSGFALARTLLTEVAGYRLDQYVNELGDKVGAALMRPHRSYLTPIRKLLQAEVVHGFAHIGGGGLTGSLQRMLPRNLAVQVDLSNWAISPMYIHLQQLGQIERDEMLSIFNAGIGLVAAVPAPLLKKAQSILNRMGERNVVVGRVVRGSQRRIIYR